MKKALSKENIEARIQFLEEWLSHPISNMNTWDNIVREYHALNIKLVRMSGGRPIAEYGKSDYII